MEMSKEDVYHEIKSYGRQIKVTRLELIFRMDKFEASLEAKFVNMQSQLQKAI